MPKLYSELISLILEMESDYCKEKWIEEIPSTVSMKTQKYVSN